MIRFTAIGGVVCAAVLLASCGSKSPAPAPTATTAATADVTSKDAMAGMAMPPKETTASGSGTVTAIDPVSGKVTLAHGPIPAAGWPAMTMAFAAKPEILKSVAVGDKVDFDLALGDGTGTVTSLRQVE